MNNLSVKGNITVILDPVNGISKAGKEWSKQEFVINTGGDYPDDICFTLFGDKSSILSGFKAGYSVEVFFNIASREYNGSYFHNVNAWKIDKLEEQEPQHAQVSDTSQKQDEEPPVDDVQDLPF